MKETIILDQGVPTGIGRPAIDHTGQRFGRLVVQRRANSNGHGGRPRWVCLCDCGNIVNVPGARLRGGSNKSCGCFRRDRAGQLYRKHGKSKTPQYTMFYDARKRAVKLGLPFNITPEDIAVPEICPVLGVPMDSSSRENAPSLDRRVPALGYVLGNIRVISFRANRIKSDASAEELRLVLRYVEGKL